MSWADMKWREVDPLNYQGIYRLLRGDTLLYIGKTMCLAERISGHIKLGRIPFNRVEFTWVPDGKIGLWEKNLIEQENPPFNTTHTMRGCWKSHRTRCLQAGDKEKAAEWERKIVDSLRGCEEYINFHL